ncbi:MAG: type III polyketide synthase [Blastomonas sp.]
MPARISAIATLVPEHRISQHEVRDHIASAMPGGMPAGLARIFERTGIDQRHLIQPPAAYLSGQDFAARNAVYLRNGQELLEKVATKALAQAGLEPGQVDMIVGVSSTGIATPSMPSQMLHGMGFRPETPVVPLFGYGCAGGILGLQVAGDMVKADPARTVLLLTLELCSLAFRIADQDKKDIIASTLFADGASAIVLRGAGDGPALGKIAQHSWPGTRSMMGWNIDRDGLGLMLSRDIPSFVRQQFAPVIGRFLADQGIASHTLAEPACHPGGRKVIEALEGCFDHLPDGLATTRKVLRENGNMSAPTIHFVLEELLERDSGPLLMTALGPGFTGAIGIIER